MSAQKRSSGLFRLVQLPVLFIIAGALFVSGAALYENMRFVRATSQILSFVQTVRTFVEQQRTVLFAPETDLWDAMIRVGQFPETVSRSNPWESDLRAVVDTTLAIRLESDLPARGCRRMALYFSGIGAGTLGLLSVDARGDESTAWGRIYPTPSIDALAAAQKACGAGLHSTLALTFSMR